MIMKAGKVKVARRLIRINLSRVAKVAPTADPAQSPQSRGGPAPVTRKEAGMRTSWVIIGSKSCQWEGQVCFFCCCFVVFVFQQHLL